MPGGWGTGGQPRQPGEGTCVEIAWKIAWISCGGGGIQRGVYGVTKIDGRLNEQCGDVSEEFT